MRVGANLHANRWQLVADGLGMLEMATAGVDLPQLWSLLETFFWKVDESFEDPSQVGTSGHSSTYCAKRKMSEGVDTSGFTPIYPGFQEEEPGNPLILCFDSKFLPPKFEFVQPLLFILIFPSCFHRYRGQVHVQEECKRWQGSLPM